MFKTHRIVEEQNINGNIVFVPQQKILIFFWTAFFELSVFPKKIEFETIESARKFLKRQVEKPKEKVYYL
jgi:hypothetical protein